MLLTLPAGIPTCKAQVARIPFEIKGSRMFIKVQVYKSDSLIFLFDTGGSGVLIDSLTAEKAGVNTVNRTITAAGGAGGYQPSVSIAHQQIDLPAGISIKDVEFTLLNLSDMNAGADTPIAGIIGSDIMDKYVVAIDFKARVLLLYNRIKDVNISGFTRIRFIFDEDDDVPRLPITIRLNNDHTIKGRILFDSGADISLLVFAPFSNFYDLRHQMGYTRPLAGKGLNISTTDAQAVIKGLSFKGFNFQDMVINLNVDDTAKKSNRTMGLMGFSIIKRFDVVLDYKDKMLYLRPNDNFSAPFTHKLDGL
jgi:hypothetical protein